MKNASKPEKRHNTPFQKNAVVTDELLDTSHVKMRLSTVAPSVANASEESNCSAARS